MTKIKINKNFFNNKNIHNKTHVANMQLLLECDFELILTNNQHFLNKPSSGTFFGCFGGLFVSLLTRGVRNVTFWEASRSIGPSSNNFI